MHLKRILLKIIHKTCYWVQRFPAVIQEIIYYIPAIGFTPLLCCSDSLVYLRIIVHRNNLFSCYQQSNIFVIFHC